MSLGDLYARSNVQVKLQSASYEYEIDVYLIVHLAVGREMWWC